MVALPLLSACDDRFPDYNYKMTIYVATPGGEKTFTGVRKIDNRKYRKIQLSGGKGLRTILRGEAIIIDLPSAASPVFALLSSQKNPDYAQQVAGVAMRSGRQGDELGGDEGYSRWMQHMVATKGSRERSHWRSPVSSEVGMQDQWPVFVKIADINDPLTVRKVNPGEIGVSRITVEIMHDSASHEIDRRFNWLNRYDYENRRFSGSKRTVIDSTDLADNLRTGSFQQGD